MRRLLSFPLFFLTLLVLWGCQNSPPLIESTDWELYRIKDTDDGEIHERLSLFLAASDQEGYEDLDAFYLYHPDSRLFWELDAGEWEKKNREGREWIGSSAFAAFERLPRGEYRLILIDRAGDRSEASFFLNQPLSADDEEEFFPSLGRNGEVLLLETGGEEGILLAESAEGRVLASYLTRDERIFIDSLGEAGERTSSDWYLFVYREEYGWYAGSGPYRF